MGGGAVASAYMILLLKTIAALAITSSGAAKGPGALSADAETSKAAFNALFKADKDVPESRVNALKLPGTLEFFSSPEGMMGLYALAQTLEKYPDGSREALELYAGLLPKIDHLTGWDGYQSTYLARAAKQTGDHAFAERVRRESADLISRTIAKNDFASPKLGDESVIKYFKLDLAHLNGNGMRDRLVDKPAPRLRFLWCSDPGVKTISDLKGKVVVLDFWATWCKPCVGLFPTIRTISEGYAGKPVVFVGVTSIQGFSIDPKAGKISCKDDPKKETSLMPDLMKQLGVTWTVAFSDKDCFDPDFDIMSIPHMAVLDQNGVVRFDDVEPEKLKERIDGLLAGMPKAAK